MKSFSQFLQESYLSEEEAVQGSLLTRRDKPQNFRGGRNPFVATDPIKQGQSSPLPATPETPKVSPGQLEIPQGRTTTLASPARRPSGAAADLFSQFSKKPQKQYGIPNPPSSSVPYGNRTLSGTSPTPALSARGETTRTGNAPLATRGTNPQAPPEALMRGAYDAANKPPATPKPSAPTPSSTVKPPAPAGPSSSSSTSSRFKAALEKQRKAAAGTGPSGRTIVTPAPSGGPSGGGPSGPSGPSGPKPPVGKPPMVKGFKAPGVRSGGVLAGVIDTALEKSSGSGWARSLAKGATTALGTLAGGAAGSFAGPVGTFAGGTAGGMAASKAFDTVAGANAVQRKAIATANRQSQSGGALKGIGGKTTFDTKKGTMTTGSGSQQRTVKLGKTSVVTDPKTGKQDVGYLAYKGGKAVYKRADTKNLAQTSSNPLERIGRSLFAGAYKQSDAAAAAKKLAAARQSDVARQKALNVKMKPGG